MGNITYKKKQELSPQPAMAYSVSRRPQAKASVQPQVSPHGNCSGQSGTGIGFFSEYLRFPC